MSLKPPCLPRRGNFYFLDHAVSIPQRQAAAIWTLRVIDPDNGREQGDERSSIMSANLHQVRRSGFARAAAVLIAISASAASAEGCLFEAQGEGRVTTIVDGRSFRLEDGREIRLAGIEPAFPEQPAATRRQVLATMLMGRDVQLRGEDDAPDRYGRQSAFVSLLPSETLVQTELLGQGEALVSPDMAKGECANALFAAEALARDAKRGMWADPSAIKNAESPGGILAGTGRFALVEGKVFSVRQAGATTYLNFGRNWTRDFAVTIPRRALANFEAAGLLPKSLENKRIRVRGIVEAKSGPRIEVLQTGQIELLGGK